MSKYFRKLKEKEIRTIDSFINYAEGGIISRAAVQRDKFSFTFFSFAAGEGIAEYAMDGEVLVQLIEGDVNVSIEGELHKLKPGDVIAVPENAPHGIDALAPSKAILYIIKP